jgi:hypothetical protein
MKVYFCVEIENAKQRYIEFRGQSETELEQQLNKLASRTSSDWLILSIDYAESEDTSTRSNWLSLWEWWHILSFSQYLGLADLIVDYGISAVEYVFNRQIIRLNRDLDFKEKFKEYLIGEYMSTEQYLQAREEALANDGLNLKFDSKFELDCVKTFEHDGNTIILNACI